MTTSRSKGGTRGIALLASLLWLLPTSAIGAWAANGAADDSISTEINTPASFNVLENDADDVSFVDHTAVAQGILSSTGHGRFKYLPDANFVGTDEFTYTVEDRSGDQTSGTVTLDVSGVIVGVEARSDHAQTEEDVPISVSVGGNDGVGPDSLALTFTFESPPAHGDVVLQADGSFVYSPVPNWSGTDEFGYLITDGVTSDSAIVSIEVASIAEEPDAVDDAILTDQGESVEIEVLANDSEADGDGFAFLEHSPATYGSVRWSERDRMLTYEPNADAYGVDTFTYAISDPDGADTATVRVTIDGKPTAVDDAMAVSQSVATTINVLANDVDPEAQSLTVASVSRPKHGEATISQDFTIRYLSDPAYTGPDSFSYSVSDHRGNQATAKVAVDVSAVGNLAPAAADDEYLLDEDSPGNTLDLLANDSDPDANPLTISIDRSPEFGYLTVGANQVVTYTPNPNFSGADSFVYSVSDSISGVDSATVTLNVQAVNDLPVAFGDGYTLDEDTESVLGVLVNDTDIDGDTLLVESADDPPYGTASIDETGALVYTPDAHYAGQDSFTYQMADGRGGTASATVAITILAVNDSPIAVDDQAETDVDAPVAVAVLDNDSDPDNESLGIAIDSSPEYGAAEVVAGNDVRYLPDPGYEGVDRFTYSVTDINGALAVATVVVIVGKPNLNPVATRDAVRTLAGKNIRINVLENDISPIDASLTVSKVSEPEHGSAKISKGKTIVYAPDDDYVGKDTFTYTVADADGRTDRVRVYINVKPADD